MLLFHDRLDNILDVDEIQLKCFMNLLAHQG